MSAAAVLHRDRAGLPLHAASTEAVRAFDALLDEYAAFRSSVPDRLRALFAIDPEMPLAHAMRAALLMLSGKGDLRPVACEAAAQAVRLSAGATPRERLHAQAVEAWTRGAGDHALRCWERILALAPTDLLALKLAQFAHFYAGDTRAMLHSTDRVLAAWHPELPHYARFLGVRAFALEESGALDAAEANGREAVERCAEEPWAIHAVAHCLETRGRPADGAAWIDALTPNWQDAGTMTCHLRWHRALFLLETEAPRDVLAQLDAGMHPETSDEYLDLCNDIALLQRLELLGLDVGARWQRLADAIDVRLGDRMLPFCDVHWVLGLAAAQRFDAADFLIDDLATRAATTIPGGESEAETLRSAALPLAKGLRHWRAGDWQQSLAALHGCHDRMHRIGGSHAQRDLFEQILVACALRAGADDLARHLLRGRRLRRPRERFATVVETIGVT